MAKSLYGELVTWQRLVANVRVARGPEPGPLVMMTMTMMVVISILMPTQTVKT